VAAPLAVYRMTSEMVGGVWPLIAADGLPPTGALMGLDLLSGEAFYADPIGWTINGIAGVTNPNIMIFGAPDQGKSGTVKVFCLRQMTYGYRTLILGDVKDETSRCAGRWGWRRTPSGTACRPGSSRWTSGRSATTGPGCRPPRRSAGPRWCSAAGCCGSRGRPGPGPALAGVVGPLNSAP